MRTQPAPNVEVLEQKQIGRFTVQVYEYTSMIPPHDKEICYRVLDERGRKVILFNDSDVRSVPPFVLRTGAEMVKAHCLGIQQNSLL